jgi:hypothetical protein
LSADASEEDKDLKDILASTTAVLFFGTPHRGSQWANTGKIVAKFAGAFGLSTSNLNLDLLAPNNALLELLRDDFIKRLDTQEKLYVTSFQENLGFKGFKGFDERVSRTLPIVLCYRTMLITVHLKIVDPDSSSIGHKKERRQPLDANHMDMCRFNRQSPSRDTYQQVVQFEIARHLARGNVLYGCM